MLSTFYICRRVQIQKGDNKDHLWIKLASAALVYGHKLYNENKLPNPFLKVRWISRFQVVVPDTRLCIRTRLKVWLHYRGKWCFQGFRMLPLLFGSVPGKFLGIYI